MLRTRSSTCRQEEAWSTPSPSVSRPQSPRDAGVERRGANPFLTRISRLRSRRGVTRHLSRGDLGFRANRHGSAGQMACPRSGRDARGQPPQSARKPRSPPPARPESNCVRCSTSLTHSECLASPTGVMSSCKPPSTRASVSAGCLILCCCRHLPRAALCTELPLKTQSVSKYGRDVVHWSARNTRMLQCAQPGFRGSRGQRGLNKVLQHRAILATCCISLKARRPSAR